MTAVSLSRTAISLAVVLASGLAALIYQVVWQRWLTLTTGATSDSVAIVVAAFLAGLSLGAVLGGSVADRRGPHRGWLIVAALEVVVAVVALGSDVVLVDLLPAWRGLGPEAPLRTWAVLLVVLVVPTVPMGMALPVLATAEPAASPRGQAARISRLSFANTLGAAAGALLVPFVLAPALGFDGAVRAGAGLNLGAAALAVWLWWSQPASVPTGPLRAGDTAVMPGPAWWVGWTAHHAAVGALTLAYELLAFRMLEHIIKARSFTFGLLLGSLLAGYAFGALAGDWLSVRLGPRPWRAFFATYVALGGVMVAAPLVIWWGLTLSPATNPWSQSLALPHPPSDAIALLFGYGVAPVLLLVVPGALMGFGFSLTQHLIHTDLASVGRRLGVLQGAAIAGSVAGAWLVAHWGFPVLGTAVMWPALGGVAAAYAILGFRKTRSWGLVVSLAVVLMIAVVWPTNGDFWRVLSGVHDAGRWHWHEGGNGVTAIVFDDPADARAATVFANGLGQSRLPRDSHPVHVTLGAVPVLLHPAPRRVAIVGLGSGATAWAASARPDTEAIVVWEVFGGQPRLLREYAARTGDPAADWFTRDPRLSIRPGDGRRHLRLGDERFDVIEADALRPESAMAGHLYSVEFFSLVRSRLRDGGLAVTWVPTPRVLATMRQVFPEVVYLGDLLAIGSDRPIEVSWETVRARLEMPGVRAHFAAGGVDIDAILAPVLQPGPRVWPVLPRRLNTDLHPRDELPPVDRWWARLRQSVWR